MTSHWLLANKQFGNTPIPGADLEQRMRERHPQVVEPEKEDRPVQGRLFNPDNPPQAFSRPEVDVHLDKIRARMRERQARRKGGPVKPTYLPHHMRPR